MLKYLGLPRIPMKFPGDFIVCNEENKINEVYLWINFEIIVKQKLKNSKNFSIKSWLSKINKKIAIKLGSRFTCFGVYT